MTRLTRLHPLSVALLAALHTAGVGTAAPQDPFPDQLWSTFTPTGQADARPPAKNPGSGPLTPKAAALRRTLGATQAIPPSLVGTASLSGIPNDNCGQAWEIPGDAVTWTAVQSTVGALGEACGAQPSCVAGTLASVWFEYTPDADGVVEFSTFGSNYDTVLAVFDGCGTPILFGCNDPEELACNDNASFNVQSQVFVSVVAGVQYKVLVAGKSGGGNLNFNFIYYPPNDACVNAMPIPGTAFDPPLLNTDNAQIDLCEADEPCEFNDLGVSNSVYYSFVPPCDGSLYVNTNGSTYDTVLSVWDGCGEFVAVGADCIVPGLLACDDDAGMGTASQVTDVPVSGLQTYIIKVADYNPSPGGGALDFNFIFVGANEPTAELTSLDNFDCVSGAVLVDGAAETGQEPFVSWSLDYQPVDGGPWTEIRSDDEAVTGGFLGSWATDGLPEEYYFLRLTVTNGCGQSATDVRVVRVDRQFDRLELESPFANTVIGGLVPIVGTANDLCFESYEVAFRPQGGSFEPIGSPSYTDPVISGKLVPSGWDTSTVPDGPYELRLSGVDSPGNMDAQTISLTVDNLPPVAEIVSPEPCDELLGMVTIQGTAADANLDRWVLQVTGGSQSTWTTIASGTSSVMNGVLANWNVTSLEHCSYCLRLLVYGESVIDGNGQAVTEFLRTVRVGRCGPERTTPPNPGG